MIAAAPADLVVSGGGPVPPGLRVRSITFGRDWLSAPSGDLPPPPGAGSPCYLVRSSGTTGGVPKLVMTTHGQEVADLDIGWSRFPLGADDRYLTVVGFQFAFGRGGAQRALIRGGAAILPPPLRSMDDLLAAVRRHRATWTR
jgi:non-ribosomal peptide synthetase component F